MSVRELTDKDKQRQRDYAATLVAQCDGKIVQLRDRGRSGQSWRNAEVAAICIDMTQYDVRIKPEPREWWTCPICSRSYGASYASAICPTPVFDVLIGKSIRCIGSLVHVREVLGDD